MAKRYILALDQGTTGSTCIIFDDTLKLIGRAYKEVLCTFPKPGWVSQDPEELWSSSLAVMRRAVIDSGIDVNDLKALGITNQRETTIIWERETGRPIHDAIVWQCRRTAPIIEKWLSKGIGKTIHKKTGLIADAYFSASKIAYILNEVPGSYERAKKGELAFGTVDSWLLYNLTKGKVHATDPSNAARTMLFNINTMQWDQELLDEFGIPKEILPKVTSNTSLFGYTDKDILGVEIPVAGMAGDQQAALFGQGCFNVGDVKNTYGTGCFLVMNTGSKMVLSDKMLLSTVAWQIDGKTCYALEGSAFSAGSAVQWLRDRLRIIRNAAETEEMALSLKDNGGVYFVPAFSGLGAPYWSPYSLAGAVGITRDTGPEHFARAVLEAAAYQTCDLLKAMESGDCPFAPEILRVDGGMTNNNFLMQFQADILNVTVERPKIVDSTALGAAALAGISQGLFTMEDVSKFRIKDRVFTPNMSDKDRNKYLEGWAQAVKRVL